MNKKKCIACKKCVRKCPVDAIPMVGGKALIDDNDCIYCAKCVRTCPVKAILKDKEHIDFEIESGVKKMRKSLAKSGNKKTETDAQK
ncbi:MAG: 4Fe-4S binding protein [Methanolobus sp.]|uniref:4Fe-4S binding protein n=1 Tax=Methanolobus sp. TaxID=1874737 RepID=UPI002731882C|nr:4Fe-4S binding protein [Methanolobus sp.]MDP2216316.1 4Fe-4S binding protein [Methanolobus sp.]